MIDEKINGCKLLDMSSWEKYELEKRDDGSILEKKGEQTRLYQKQLLPLWLNVKNITYVRSIYNPGGEQPAILEEREDHFKSKKTYKPEYSERLGCDSPIKDNIAFFGEQGMSELSLDIFSIPETSKDKISYGSLCVFSENGRTMNNYIELFIEQDIFDQIKEMHLNSTLHSVTVSLDFSRETNIYQERNYEVPYTSWRIEQSGKEEEDSNHSEEFEGLLRKINITSKNQNLSHL